MRNQLGISLVTRLMLALPRRLKVVGVALKESTPANYESAHRPFLARLPAQTAAAEDRVTNANGAVTEDSMYLGSRSNLPITVEDVPMHHLFLLDMKIGR